MNQHQPPAPRLKLVGQNSASLLPPVADVRPVPTQEFLARRVLALDVGGESVGTLLAEAAAYLRPDGPVSAGRCSSITDALMLVGIWICPPEDDEDPPTHGLVVHPDKLVRMYPELKRVTAELEGLKLELPITK